MSQLKARLLPCIFRNRKPSFGVVSKLRHIKRKAPAFHIKNIDKRQYLDSNPFYTGDSSNKLKEYYKATIKL
jgi:hypothetical protein